MRHPTDGTLRRLVDEPSGVPDPDRQHVAGCPVCLSGLAEAQQTAAATAAALPTGDVPDVDRGWQRLSAQAARSSADVPRRSVAPAGRWRRAVRSPAVAAFGVVIVLGGAGAAAAGDWLPVFRTDQIAPVQVSTADLVALPDVSAYGDLQVVSEPEVHEVADAAAAREESGLDVPEVAELPGGVTGTPTYTVGGRLVADFTFSAARATEAAAAAGEQLPPVPAGLDGSRFQLVAGPGTALTWSSASGLPALVVARVAAPTASSAGVPFETARDYLLSVPGIPDQLAAQLRAFPDADSTLPLPVPAEFATASTTEVRGHQATVLTSRDGSITGVVWVADGIVTAVGGSLDEDEVLTVARDLR
jgi:hypothetical protein